MTKVIHITNARNLPDEVYIGRAGHGYDGYYGNPVIKGHKCPMCRKIHEKSGDTLACFRQYAINRIANDIEYRDRIKALKDKTLVCFCVNEQKCHGSILSQLSDMLNSPIFNIKSLRVSTSVIDTRTIHDRQNELEFDNSIRKSNNPYTIKG